MVESLLKIVLLCGRQGLALHGHCDDKVTWTEEERHSNEDNFVELVRFGLKQILSLLITSPIPHVTHVTHLNGFKMN